MVNFPVPGTTTLDALFFYKQDIHAWWKNVSCTFQRTKTKIAIIMMVHFSFIFPTIFQQSRMKNGGFLHSSFVSGEIYRWILLSLFPANSSYRQFKFVPSMPPNQFNGLSFTSSCELLMAKTIFSGLSHPNCPITPKTATPLHASLTCSMKCHIFNELDVFPLFFFYQKSGTLIYNFLCHSPSHKNDSCK